MSYGWDTDFSRALGAAGWLGMAIPVEYGGHGRSVVERFVVLEELLAARAPVSAHWIADRQMAPSILRYGTEAHKQTILPAIARGECYFCIGMSEPDTGSDLASVRTRATQVDGGWTLDGTKIWTSGADKCHFAMTLVRTSAEEADRHRGLSSFIVDLATPGVTATPIRTMDGEAEFCEVRFEEAFIPDEMVLGSIGDGWRQVTSELAFERSAPDRWLTPWALFTGALDRVSREDGAAALGRLAARWRVVRNLSLSVARLLDEDRNPNLEAALVKDIGTRFEQEVVEVVRAVLGADPDPADDDPYTRLLSRLVVHIPAVTLRGGTTEVLRTIIVRDLR
jgi:alkylation response protein AidB-like acyl-CoA dehydrogenase